MTNAFDWMVVRDRTHEIGAIGFINNNAVAVVSFYEDRDWNEDDTISTSERIGGFVPLFNQKGRALTKVAVQSYLSNPDIAARDPSIRAMAGKFLSEFGFGLVAEGVWIVYFRGGVKATAAGAATMITSSRVKQLVIRKGFEKAAKAAFDAANKL